jgi:hypothetical protein
MEEKRGAGDEEFHIRMRPMDGNFGINVQEAEVFLTAGQG